MSSFIELFPDMAPVLSTIFRSSHLERLGLTDEVPDIASLGFSGVSFDVSFSFEEDAIHAPFDAGSIIVPDLPSGDLSSTHEGLSKTGNPGVLITTTSTDDPPQDVSCDQRRFGNDVTNQQHTTTSEVQSLVASSSRSSSEASSVEMEVPKATSAASSSSPTGKSARQRKEMNLGAPSRSNKPTAPPVTQDTQTDGKTPCCIKGCKVRFCDTSTRNRHVLSEHLEICAICPGCDSLYSRPDSLK